MTDVLDTVNVGYIKRKGLKLTDEEFFNQQFVYIDKCMVGCYLAVFIKRKLS